MKPRIPASALRPAAMADADAGPARTHAVLRSRDLFGNAQEVIIEHLGVEYRLRQTRNGKLLLYK